MADWRLRLRAVLDEHFAAVVAALVVCAVLGGWVTYATHAAPGTVTEERPASAWETTGQFEHGATVTKENPVYSVGRTLSDRSVYFTGIAPRLDGTYRFTYDASDGGELNGTTTLSLVIREVERRERGENVTVLWRTSRPLNEVSTESLEPGETVAVPFAVDVRAVANRTERIHDRLGGSPGETEVLVRATVDLRGTVNGREVDRTETYTLPVALSGNTYRPGSSAPTTERHETMQAEAVPKTYGPVRNVGGPAVLLGSLLAVVGLVSARSRNRLGLSERERTRLAYEDDRSDFDEWISTIRLPEEAFDLPEAEASSLGALVDFAIDTDNSVVNDPDDDAYYVVHDGYLYAYRPPASRGHSEADLEERQIDSGAIDEPQPASDPDVTGDDALRKVTIDVTEQLTEGNDIGDVVPEEVVVQRIEREERDIPRPDVHTELRQGDRLTVYGPESTVTELRERL